MTKQILALASALMLYTTAWAQSGPNEYLVTQSSPSEHRLVNLRVLDGGELLLTEAGEGEAVVLPASLDSYEIFIRFKNEKFHFENIYVVDERVFQGMHIKDLQSNKVKVTLVWDRAEQLTMIHVKDDKIKTFATDKLPPLAASN